MMPPLHDQQAELSALSLALHRPGDAFECGLTHAHIHDADARKAWVALAQAWSLGHDPSIEHVIDEPARNVLLAVRETGVMPLAPELLIERLGAARVRRDVVALADRAQRMAIDGASPDILEAELARIRFGHGDMGKPQLASSTEDILDEMEWRMANPGQTMGLRVGLKRWEETLDGLKQGYHIIAARPGEGKTALIVQMLRHMALDGNPVGLFSLEMPARQIRTRLLMAASGIPVGGFMDRPYTAGEMQLIGDGMVEMQRLDKMHIWDDGSLDVQNWEAIQRAARRAVREDGLRCIGLDYVQLLRLGKPTDNRQAELAYISQQIKALSGELRVPILVAAQLQRPAVIQQGKKPRPGLANLKETGALEQDADTVTLVHDDGDVCKLLLDKHRAGKIAEIEVEFMREQARFREI